jgi:hypothetical protein
MARRQGSARLSLLVRCGTRARGSASLVAEDAGPSPWPPPKARRGDIDARGLRRSRSRPPASADQVGPWRASPVAPGPPRIERLNPRLNAVVTEMFESARAAALAGPPCRPFTGVPFVLKDLAVEHAGVRFTEGSRFLRDNVSAHDQELAVRLRRAGLVVVGKTNTCEFGMRPTCEPARFSATRNPWDTTRTPGGSSGGTAAAVAAAMVPMGHGNDAGGSLRFPGILLRPFRAQADACAGSARSRVRRLFSGWRRARADPERGRQRGAPGRRRGHRPRRSLPRAGARQTLHRRVAADPDTLRVAFWAAPFGDSALHRPTHPQRPMGTGHRRPRSYTLTPSPSIGNSATGSPGNRCA